MLARLLRFDPKLLHSIRPKTLEQRIDLATIKTRDAVVRARTTLITTVRGMLKPFGIKVTSEVTVNQFYPKILAHIPKELKTAFSGIVKQINNLTNEINRDDKKIGKLCKKYPATEKLRQVKGVGPLTALTYVLIINDPLRFNDGKRLGKYVGLTPRRDQSGDTDKQLPITKAGNKLLRRLLVEAANYIMGPFGEPCKLREFGEKKAAKGGKIAKRKAKVAVARKLAVLLRRLWISEEEYQPMGKKAIISKLG